MSDKKIKTSLYIRRSVWREIKKAAIDAGQTMGEFVTRIFTKWRYERNAYFEPTDPASGVEDKTDRG